MKPVHRLHLLIRAAFVILVFLPVCAGTQERSKTPASRNSAQQSFEAAQTFQIAGDYENAAAQYRASIAQALRQLGNLKLSRQELADATDLFAQAVAMNSSDADAHVDLAIVRFQSGHLDAARTEIEAALKENARNTRALVFAGKLSFLQQDYPRAIERLQAALQLQPDFETGYVLALANLAAKNPLPAGVIFDEMLAANRPDANVYVLIGIAYREYGYYDRAVMHFMKAIELDPHKRNVHAALGITHYLQGAEHDEEARKAFRAELPASPGDYTSTYYLGLLASREQKWLEAIDWFKQAAAAQPESQEAYVGLGEAEINAGLANDAVVALRKSLQLPASKRASKTTARTYTLLAEAFEKLGQSDESRTEAAEAKHLELGASDGGQDSADTRGILEGPSSELRQVLQLSSRPSDPVQSKEPAYAKGLRDLLGEAFHNLGVIDARASRFTQATDEFAQAARWNPTIDRLDRNWGVAAFRAERYDQAVGPLSRELKKKEDDTTLRQMLGLSYFMTDQFAKSAETFRPIINQLPDNPGLLYAAGASLVRSGDSNAGRPLLLRMQEIGANSAEVHLMIAQAYSQQAQFREALDELQRAERLNPALTDLHFAIGMVYLKQGKLDDALKEFEKELAANPGSVSSKYQIAAIRLQQRDTAQAISLLNDVLREKPDYADGHYQLGKALLESGDPAGAIPHLEECVKLQPEQPYGYYQLSLAYRRAGRAVDADKALQRFLQLKDSAPKKLRSATSSP